MQILLKLITANEQQLHKGGVGRMRGAELLSDPQGLHKRRRLLDRPNLGGQKTPQIHDYSISGLRRRLMPEFLRGDIQPILQSVKTGAHRLVFVAVSQKVMSRLDTRDDVKVRHMLFCACCATSLCWHPAPPLA